MHANGRSLVNDRLAEQGLRRWREQVIGMIVDLGHDQPSGLDVQSLATQIELPKPLLNHDLPRRIRSSIVQSARTLNPRYRLEHRKRLANPWPGAAVFGLDGVDVQFGNGCRHFRNAVVIPFRSPRMGDNRIWLNRSHEVLVGPHFSQAKWKVTGKATHPFVHSLIEQVPPDDFVDLKPRLAEHRPDAVQREESQVRAVEQPRVSVVPFAFEKVANDCPVLHVGDAGENLGTGPHNLCESLENLPWLMKMFKNVSENENVRRRFQIHCPDTDLFDVSSKQIIDASLCIDGNIASGVILLNSNPVNPRIDPPIRLAQRTLTAADLKDGFRIGGNQGEQVFVVSRVVAFRRHGIAPMKGESSGRQYIGDAA